MKKSPLVFALVIIFSTGYSQKVHTPFEILKLLTDSKLSYQVEMLKNPVPKTDYSDKLNRSDIYRVVSDSGINTYLYKLHGEAIENFKKAEAYFKASDDDNAMLWYKNTLGADSSLAFVMTYVGQMYEKKNDHASAINWYKKAVEKNYIDYMAHWFLADNYKSVNDLENAVNEITIARILNRNNPRLKKSFDAIFLKAKRDTTDWQFNPQIEITHPNDSTVKVAMNDKWTGYAMAKALWMYEPGYRESMGVAKGEHSTLEDRECLIALLIGETNAKTKTKGYTELSILKQASENKHLDEYIFYELVLPQTPAYAYQLPEKQILDIKDYILNVRNKKR